MDLATDFGPAMNIALTVAIIMFVLAVAAYVYSRRDRDDDD